ncbi:probable HTS1 - histidine--tRNA ligase, mitochondrial [Melanopsichium pennsylvanicum]|uniref:Histidine--tRNA ligase, mitochondrial n=2 Tax=Melanopsichium pennsylvanicum TaxID=63383 RepID=A0AAJ4XTP9_9BASI|nr:probable HTS1-histidine--tRNA ligase, mitochondrial [Melanopsichium pennsylvanicum 4]SNX87846.1 probable HTS1 - histidine--tRNA ligase, mitochondrial [Melanopsichium pennsylvanicum]
MSSSDADPKIASLQAERNSQDDKVQQLRASNAEQATLKAEIGKLKRIEAQLAALGLGGSKTGSSKQEVKFTLKTPKGTRDWEPLAMSLRKRIFSTIEDVFSAHGAVTIDTPVFELKEILSGKYGEDSKLIYDLQDQGGELCSLRYDLTVPFARFVAMNPSEYGNIKRYHIAKVYRRDQPAMSKGRFREFYQCDIDIAGVYDPMVPDSEVLCILVEALDALGIDGFTIKINHRKILDGIFDICGVPADKIRTISSAVDKLDKSPWEEVKREMTQDKGLAEEVADKIGEYVKLKGGRDLLEKLKADATMTGHPTASQGVEDMELLFDYLDVYGISDRMSFDLSLARGLDYYTGLIYEAVTAASAPPGFNGDKQDNNAAEKKSKKTKKGADGEEEVDESTVGVGSIAAGGRYDNLVGMFSGSKKPDAVPCVGVSIGVERVFAIMMQRLKEKELKGERTSVRSKEVDVYVMSVGEGLLKERMQVTKMLWDAGIKAEFMHKAKPKLPAQFGVVDKEGIPFAVILAPNEWNAQDNRQVRVKQQKGKDSDEGQGQGQVVRLDDLIKYLKGLGAGVGATPLAERQSLI